MELSTGHKISVIIPAFNAESFIEKTLKSVLQQTFLPHEVIVVDDGSTDKTRSIIQKFNVSYYHQKNQGVAKALNYGVRKSTGNVLAFLDHDDIWLPDKLELQIGELNKHPQTDIVFTLIENIVSKPSLKNQIEITSTALNGIHKSTFLVKKDSFLKAGYLSSQVRSQEFLNWYAIALDVGLHSRLVQKVLVQRVIHGANQTLTNKSIKSDFPKVLKAILDRRRGDKTN